ncbi:hexamerin-like [Onthophagus taurus]|uniref:hexamerin-like n=1 Tax=Onthophagus taurus TaxID=166361 RepID=UPI000C200EEB|nr:hexamerin-like [Onthophagus taurus]
MKIAVVFAAIFAVSFAIPTPTNVIPKKYKIDDNTFLVKTEQIQRLFRYVNQPTYYKDFVDTATTYQPWTHPESYTDKKYVEDFFHYYDNDILPRGSIFSIFYQEHLKPAVALFKLFYYAKDYQTFFNTAVWARQHVNEGMFLYSFTVAVTHRQDTFGVIIPPIYETYPYYFFNTETITEAQTYKQLYDGVYPKSTVDNFVGYTIESNYSGWYMNLHPEQSLSYFTEDVGLNSFYYYYHINYPFWMDGDEFNLKKDNRGEIFYFIHQQLLARYYLERLSNGFGEIEKLHYDDIIKTGYYPSLHYPNGLDFPSRPNYINIGEHWQYNHPYYNNFTNAHTYVYDYARRIRDAIDIGFVYTKDGTKVSLNTDDGVAILANMLEGNPDSPNIDFYGVLQMYARHLLGYTYTPLHKYKVVPAALEHYETSLRDPVFWQFYKWVIGFVYEYKSHLPYYSKKELLTEGVEVDSFKVDRLITYFDDFYANIGQGVIAKESELTGEPFSVRVKQHRLNHKPFSYHIGVTSKKPVEVIGKVFIGPKYDEYNREIELDENRVNFVLIDKFTYTLKQGHNMIERSSKTNYFVPDRTTYLDVYKRLLTSIKNHEEFVIDGSEAFWGFPNRLLLPKGTVTGQKYQFYVIFYEYHPNGVVHQELGYPRVGSGVWDVDHKSFGYPFDRTIDYHNFVVPNSYFKEVVIFHKDVKDLNTTN